MSVLKRSRRKKHTLVAAVDDGQLPRAATVAPTLTRPNTRAAAHAVAAAAATLTTAAVTSKPTRAKRAVRKAPLVTSDAHPSTGASLTGFANTALINLPPSAVPSIDLPPPRRMSTRRASADPLVRHGYAMQGPIAAGAFSTIVRAKEVASGHEVAVKSFDNTKCRKDAQHACLRNGELGALRLAREPEVCAYIANMIAEHEGPTHTYAILEYCPGGSLQRHLQKLTITGRDVGMPDEEVAVVTSQITSAMAHLHALEIAHRDLKPGNVLFCQGRHVKVCDFGFAKRCVPAGGGECRRLVTLCGTPVYMAPELTMCSKEGYWGPPVDMWALGAMVYEMLHCRPAFHGCTELQLQIRIRGGAHAPVRVGTSKGARAILKALLTPKVEHRLTALELAQRHAGWIGR